MSRSRPVYEALVLEREGAPLIVSDLARLDGCGFAVGVRLAEVRAVAAGGGAFSPAAGRVSGGNGGCRRAGGAARCGGGLAVSLVMKPAEGFRAPFSVRNSEAGILRFPFPFREDKFMYGVNLEPRGDGWPNSAYEAMFDIDEHYLGGGGGLRAEGVAAVEGA